MLSGLEAALSERVPDEIEPLVSAVRVRQFIATGTAGVAVELAVLASLVEFGVAGEVLSAVAGKEAAVFVMFALNERWTFDDSGTPGLGPLARRLGASHVARGLGNGVALAVYVMLFAWAGVWYVAANLVGIAVGFVFNYLIEGLVTWRPHATG